MMFNVLYRTIMGAWRDFRSFIATDIISRKKLLRLTYTEATEVTDEFYALPPKEWVIKIATSAPFRWLKWKAETLDCDDFAEMFRVYARRINPEVCIGMVKVRRTTTSKIDMHMLNFTILKGKKEYEFWFIEPQDGSVFSFSEGYSKGYAIEWVYV